MLLYKEKLVICIFDSKKIADDLVVSEKTSTFASAIEKQSQVAQMAQSQVAQMAESVDALVSNTSGVTSIPVRPRVWVQ